MHITHNSNNDWREEAQILGVDPQLITWIAAVIKDERTKAAKEIEEVQRHLQSRRFDSMPVIELQSMLDAIRESLLFRQ